MTVHFYPSSVAVEMTSATNSTGEANLVAMAGGGGGGGGEGGSCTWNSHMFTS